MRHNAHWGRAGAVFGAVLFGRHGIYPVRCGSSVPLSVGVCLSSAWLVRVLRDAHVHRHPASGIRLSLEKRRARLGARPGGAGGTPAMMEARASGQEGTGQEETRQEEIGQETWSQRLREWNPAAISEIVEFRGELTVTVGEEYLGE